MMKSTKIPVTVITGFLGSGKTTLLNRLLADGVKTAVVINEFGTTPVDQDFLQDQSMPMTVLSGGCLCCQIKGALAPTLKNLWMAWSNAETRPFERIMIETSGVASPEPILDTLLREPWLSKRYALQQVVTTLAMPSAIAQLERHAEARAQVAWADTLLLTHADLADSSQQTELIDRLREIAPATPLHFGLKEFASALQTATPKTFRRLPDGDTLIEHSFRSISLHLEYALPWPQLQAILQDLLTRHSTDLLRIKGVVYLAGQTEPVVIQAAANRLYPPSVLSVRTSDDQRSRLVFITSGFIEPLAEALADAFGAGLGNNAIRLH